MNASYDICRFCERINYMNVSVFDKKIVDKIERYLPIKIASDDPLPKGICANCVDQLQAVHLFVTKAVLANNNLWKKCKSTHRDVNPLIVKLNKLPNVTATCSATPSTSKVSAAPATNTTEESVKAVLQKLKSTNLVVKKVPPKNGSKYVMKLEVLDEALENNPELVEDMMEYDETDDEELDSEDGVLDKDVTDPEFVCDDKNESEDLDFDDSVDYKPARKSPKKKPASFQTSPTTKSTTKKPASTVIKLESPAAYVCMTCKNKYSTFEELKSHIETSGECKRLSLTCDICGKVCDNKKSLYGHKNTHLPKMQYVCEECGKTYSNSFNLENHKSQVHGHYIDEIGCVYKCKMCDNEYANRKDLYAHIVVHSKEMLSLLCDTCGKHFTSQDALRSHLRMHLDIRPFACTDCDKRFRTRLLLIQHTHIHTGIKLFKCDVCDKSFAKKGSLTMHYRTHSSETPHVCSFCGDKCDSPESLKTHYLTHKDDLAKPQPPPVITIQDEEEEYEITFVTE